MTAHNQPARADQRTLSRYSILNHLLGVRWPLSRNRWAPMTTTKTFCFVLMLLSTISCASSSSAPATFTRGSAEELFGVTEFCVMVYGEAHDPKTSRLFADYLAAHLEAAKFVTDKAGCRDAQAVIAFSMRGKYGTVFIPSTVGPARMLIEQTRGGIASEDFLDDVISAWRQAQGNKQVKTSRGDITDLRHIDEICIQEEPTGVHRAIADQLNAKLASRCIFSYGSCGGRRNVLEYSPEQRLGVVMTVDHDEQTARIVIQHQGSAVDFLEAVIRAFEEVPLPSRTPFE